MRNLKGCHPYSSLSQQSSAVSNDESLTCRHLSPPQCGTQLTRVILRGNLLSSTEGLEALTLLEAVDIGHNLITTPQSALAGITVSPHLHQVWVEGNPVTHRRHYRPVLLALFPPTFKVRVLLIPHTITLGWLSLVEGGGWRVGVPGVTRW